MPSHKECCKVSGLARILDGINDARAERNEKRILMKDWSSFLSGMSPNKVRQLWITKLNKDECIPRSKAIVLIAAINKTRRQLDMKELDSDKTLVREDQK